MQTIHHALELSRSIGLILDYIFVDSYRYEQLFRLFAENDLLIPLVSKIVSQHEKFDALVRCYSKNKTQARSHVPLIYCKVLFKMLTNQCDAAKTIFL